MPNVTTKIIRQSKDFFIAETTDGRLRIGILDTAGIDIPYRHDDVLKVAAIANDDDFDIAADDLFYDLWSHTV